jgi:hypothetical protein
VNHLLEKIVLLRAFGSGPDLSRLEIKKCKSKDVPVLK